VTGGNFLDYNGNKPVLFYTVFLPVQYSKFLFLLPTTLVMCFVEQMVQIAGQEVPYYDFSTIESLSSGCAEVRDTQIRAFCSALKTTIARLLFLTELSYSG